MCTKNDALVESNVARGVWEVRFEGSPRDCDEVIEGWFGVVGIIGVGATGVIVCPKVEVVMRVC